MSFFLRKETRDLSSQASPNVSSTRAGATPLLLAATAAPNTSMLRQLLEARAAVPPRRHIEKLAKNEEIRCLGKGHFLEEESQTNKKSGGKQKGGS